MSVSGSSDWTLTRDGIITRTLQLLGVLRPGGTAPAADISTCSDFLNMMVKSWGNKGIHMWSLVEGTLFLRVGVTQYTISATSTDNAGDNVIETTVTSGSSTSLTVSSTVGMVLGQQVGIELDDNTRFWTTIASVDSSTTLTLNSGMPSSTSSGNSVAAYTTASSKPLHISSCRYRTKDNNDMPIYMRGRDEFGMIPSKTQQGSSINQAFYSTGRDSGTMYIWPAPNNCAGRIKFSYARALYDFDASSDNADVPVEWLNCVVKNLAANIGPVYNIKPERQKMLEQMARDELVEMQMFDMDNASVRIVPNFWED